MDFKITAIPVRRSSKHAELKNALESLEPGQSLLVPASYFNGKTVRQSVSYFKGKRLRTLKNGEGIHLWLEERS